MLAMARYGERAHLEVPNLPEGALGVRDILKRIENLLHGDDFFCLAVNSTPHDIQRSKECV